jgi:hypothetical protein
MAISKVEKELLVQGMAANTPSKGPYIQNMFWENDNWKTRKGFAQIAQFDTKFGIAPKVPAASADTQYGYEEHLGSYLIKTDYGHFQIISVFSAKIHTGAFAAPVSLDSRSTGAFTQTWIANVYDVTDNTRYEQLLHRPTSDNNRNTIEMDTWFGHQETRLEVDREKVKNGDESMATFVEFDDAVLFGNPIMGLWYYKASKFMFDEPRTGQTSGFVKQNSSCPWEVYSESAVISEVLPVDGFFSDSYAYLDESTFTAPNAMATLGNRLCYGVGREVFFSDEGNPNSIIATNQITIQSQELIGGMAEISGSLVIWTENETFLYQPNQGALINAGRLTQISDNIGIVSNNAFVKLEGKVVWMDINGVYSCPGTFNIEKLSDNINQFFTDELANPLNNYFKGLNVAPPVGGAVGVGDPLATTWYNMLGEPYVSLAYDAATDQIFISIPTKNIFLVLQDGNWHIWNFESQATDQEPPIYDWQTQAKVALSWVLAKEDRVFIVGSTYDRTYSDQAIYGGTQIAPEEPVNMSTTAKSYVVLEQGVAGGCDRSPVYFTDDLQTTSDTTTQSGCYKLAKDSPLNFIGDPTINEAEFVIGPPIKKEVGYVLPYNPAHTETTPASTTFLFPVYLKYEYDANAANTDFQAPLRQLNDVTAIGLEFQFDNRHWRPVSKNNLPAPYPANFNYVMLVFPPERTDPLQMAAWGLDAPSLITVPQTQVRDSVTGLPDVEGNTLYFQTAGLPTAPPGEFGGVGRRYQLLFYIPFTRKNNSASSELGVRHTGVNSFITTNLPAPPASRDAQLYYYAYYDNRAEQHGFNALASHEFHSSPIEQPVDWLFKSGEIGLAETEQIRTRGIFCEVKSHGNAVNVISPDTYFGQFNALLGSDYKEWCSQIIDMGDAFENPVAMATTFPPNIQAIIDGLAIRTRWWNSHPPPGNDAAISYKVFGTRADSFPLYGQSFAPFTAGDYLLDDEQFDVISFSDSVKGKYFTWMLFGHIRNWAEHLQLYSVKAVLRPAGGRRRKGRSAGGRL